MDTIKQEVHHIDDDNALTIQIRESNVEKETALSLLNEFTPFFKQAEEWKKKAKSIIITDASQVEEMGRAREARLVLKNIRVDVEKKRRAMKEESLRKGKAIDGIANIIKFLIVPIETYLQEQEDFVKFQEEKRKAKLQDKRESELSQYDIDTQYYNLGEMPEEGYQQLLKTGRTAYESQKEAERKIEEERIAREKIEVEERERIRKENERLKKEAKEQKKQAEIERKKREKEEAERKVREEAEKKKAEEELYREREALEKAEAKLKAQREAKEREILAERGKRETERKAKEKSERDARLAPDKEKLRVLAVRIAEIEMPDVMSTEARKIIKDVIDLLNKTSNYIKEKSCNL